MDREEAEVNELRAAPTGLIVRGFGQLTLDAGAIRHFWLFTDDGILPGSIKRSAGLPALADPGAAWRNGTMTPQECAAMGEMMGGMMGEMMGGMINGGMMGDGWTGGGMLWFGLLALALIVAIGLAVGVLVSRRSTGSAADDPREIVRRRFARGELSTEEFAAAMKTLG